LVWLEYF